MNKLFQNVKKYIALVAVTLLVFATGTVVDSTKVIAADAPDLKIYGGTLSDIKANDGGTVGFAVKNYSSIDAINVNIDATSSTLSNVSAQGMTIITGNGENTIVLSYTAPSGSAQHNVKLDLTYEYLDGTETKYGSTILNVTLRAIDEGGSTSTPTGSPTFTLTSPSTFVPVKAGESVDVNVTIKNSGTASANSITLTGELDANFSVSFLNNSNDMGNLYSKASKDAKVRVTVPKDVKAGPYLVKLNVNYQDAQKVQKTATVSFYIRVAVSDTETERPFIVIRDFNAPTGLIAGNAFDISTVIENTAAVNASNLTIVATLDPALSFYNASGSVYHATLDSKAAKDLTFKLTSNEKTATGSYPVKLAATYYDKDGKEYKSDYTFYVNVTKKPSATGDDIERAYLVATAPNPGGTHLPGKDFTVSFTLWNDGVLAAKQIKVTAVGGDAVVPKSANIQQLATLEPGTNKVFTFTFAATSAAKTQNYPIGFTVEYDTGAKDDKDAKIMDTFTQYVGANVSNPEEDKKDEETSKSIPKIIVSRYKIEPELVQAGSTFDMNIDFQNTHIDKTIKNIRVSWSVIGTETVKGNVFTPFDSSNMFYIDSMGPKEVLNKVLTMNCVPDALPKNYIVTFELEYEDESDTQYTSKVEVGVNVKQVAKFDIGDINANPTTLSVGDMMYINFNIQNTGKVTLNNLKVKLVSDALDTNGTEIIYGNFQSGSYDYYDASATAINPGDAQTVTVVATFDTDTGETMEVTKDFEINVMEGMMGGDMNAGFPGDKFPMDPGMGMPMEQPSLFTNWIFWVAVGAGVLVIGGVVTFIVIKVRKKKGMNLGE